MAVDVQVTSCEVKEEKTNDYAALVSLLDRVAFGRSPNLALQQELGLLSEWNIESGARNSTSSNAHGPHINPAKISPLQRGPGLPSMLF